MQDISFMSSKPEIIKGTEVQIPSRTIKDQLIEIPSSWCGSRCGSYRVERRSVLILGTINVKKYSQVETRKYGTIGFKK
jgi:hypothetical protein